MILVDANLLLYAKAADMPQHRAAAAWFAGRVRDGERIGLPWPTLLAFVRVGTNPRLFNQPLGMAAAWKQVEEWLGLPGAWIPQPTEQHAKVLGGLLLGANASGNLVTDAHLAALAVEHGLEVCSTDADFARFPGVRWRNPLVARSTRTPAGARAPRTA